MKQVTSAFTQYEFTESEMEELLQLPPMLEMYLQTRMAMIAQEKLYAKFDPQNPMAYAQLEAELAGKLSILDELLVTSRDIRERKSEEYQSS